MFFTGLCLLVIAGVLIYILLPSNDKPLSPYYGWRTYCNNTTKVCFKYPKAWKQAEEEPIPSFMSSNNGLEISYQTSIACSTDIRLGNTYTVSIENLSTNPKISVVGLITDNVPGYVVVDTDSLSSYPTIRLHRSVHGLINYCFGFDKGSWIVATPNNTFDSLSSAKAWFNTQNAKTALLSLKSISIN